MKITSSWLAELCPGLPPARAVADALTRAGFEVEGLRSVGADVAGVVVGEVLSFTDVVTKKKTVRLCQVRVAPDGPEREIICGADNFAPGDRVAVALPGAVLPGGFTITARRTYGHVSDGMICSVRELGLGEESGGILVLPPDTPLGADVVEALDAADDVLELDVTPDRGYALSARGLAREVASAFGLAYTDPAAAVMGGSGGSGGSAGPGGSAGSGPAEPGPHGYPVVVEDLGACDRYVARVITGIDPARTTPSALARRLTNCGMRPISVPVDVANLVMLSLGQPLHTFDRARLRGPIVVRRARAGEHLVTLDGVDRTLDPDDLVIADDSGPVALAGVMGGAATEIGPSTTEIVLEAAHFDPASVSRTARRHQLFSEASRRFERGVDPTLPPVAAAEAVRLLAELAGGAAAAGATDVDSTRAPAAIRFPLAETERLGGRPYPEEVVRARLAEVGCTVEDDPAGSASGSGARSGPESGAGSGAGSGAAATGPGIVLVTPPPYRPDLTRPADLVEEVMRLEGYDTIPVTLPRTPPGRGLTPRQRLRRSVGLALAQSGYVEVATLPFVAADTPERLGLADDDPRAEMARITNPIAEDAAYARPSLLPGLFAAAVRNIGRGQPDLALFETGLVFRRRPGAPSEVATPTVEHRPSSRELAAIDAVLPDQPRLLAGVLTGRRRPAGWWGPGEAASWADAVAAARTAAEAAGLDGALGVEAAAAMPWHPGRCAGLRLAGAVIGYAGELHPRVVAAYGLPERACAFELDLDALVAAGAARPPVVAASPSTFPPADRDVALLVDVEVPAAAVAGALRGGAGELLESLRLFDVYEGAQAGAGRRSLAFGLRLRAADRTLTAEEANAARDAAVAEAGRLTGAVLRG